MEEKKDKMVTQFEATLYGLLGFIIGVVITYINFGM